MFSFTLLQNIITEIHNYKDDVLEIIIPIILILAIIFFSTITTKYKIINTISLFFILFMSTTILFFTLSDGKMLHYYSYETRTPYQESDYTYEYEVYGRSLVIDFTPTKDMDEVIFNVTGGEGWNGTAQYKKITKNNLEKNKTIKVNITFDITSTNNMLVDININANDIEYHEAYDKIDTNKIIISSIASFLINAIITFIILNKRIQYKICPNCDRKNSYLSTYCNNCGKVLKTTKVKCPICQKYVKQNANYCTHCGAKINTKKED